MINYHDVMKGVNAAVLTPLLADLSPNYQGMAYHCQWLLKNGCDGLGLLGTTGEAASFTVCERMKILDEIAIAEIPMIKTIPGTGAAAIGDAVELTRHALSLGVGGVLMLPPFYYKGVTDAGIFAAYSEVIEQLGDSRLKLYLYNFPQMSGVPVSFNVISWLIERYPKTVVGIKDSSGKVENMLAMVEEFPEFAVLSGSESAFLPVLQAGGAGCITAVSNIVSRLAQRVYSSWIEDGEADKKAWHVLNTIRKIITRYPLVAALKAVMAQHSCDPTWENIRPPLMRLNDNERVALFASFEETKYHLPHL